MRYTVHMKENLNVIFKELRGMISKYSPPLVVGDKVNAGAKPQYVLVSKKAVVIGGKKKNEVYFAGVIEQKGYVGFYYMPVYTNAEMKEIMSPALLRLLKGKSCFYIKELSPALKKDIQRALKAGFALYKKRRWI